MSEHNGLPRRRVVWIILKLATPYQLLLTMSVKLTQFVTHSLNARALSSVLAAYLPWVARTHSPRGGAVMSTTRPHTCTGTTHPEVESPRLDRGGARRREGDLRRRWLWTCVRWTRRRRAATRRTTSKIKSKR